MTDLRLSSAASASLAALVTPLLTDKASGAPPDIARAPERC